MRINSAITHNQYLLSTDQTYNIIASYDHDLIDCLDLYFSKKKKNKCLVLNDDNENILNTDYHFIYVPYNDGSVDNNFQFKQKSIMNSEVANIIVSNQQNFLSIERMREELHSLLTDDGIYKLSAILNLGLTHKVSFDVSEFSVNAILQFLEIQTEELTISEKYQIIYNLLLFINRDNENLVYIDFPVDEECLTWLVKLGTDNNIFLINNESIQTNELSELFPSSFQIITGDNYKESYEVGLDYLSSLSYIFHSYILRNMNQQTRWNRRLYKMFSHQNTTFHIFFDDTLLQQID